jgi:hypothetical protein
MEQDVLERIPAFQDLLTALKMAGVADLVWGVLGGNPASYDLLKSDWVEAGSPMGADKKDAVVKVVEDFITDKLRTSTEKFNEAKETYPSLVPVYDQFKTVDVLPASEAPKLPTDKVLRRVAKKGQKEGDLVPSSPAMALVMRYSVARKPPSLDVVRKALGTK